MLGEVWQGQVQEVEEEESPPQAQYAHSEKSNAPWPEPGSTSKGPESADYPEGPTCCMQYSSTKEST